jgi:esterase/lipase
MKNKASGIVLLIFGILVIVFLAGPRTKIDTHLKTISLPDDLDRYLTESEAQHPDIIPGTEKIIHWANPDKRKTPLSIIYLHGYSATRQESAPLSEHLAAKLGANLFYTRFTGHGETGEALARATINDFFNDSMEAMEIGKRLGEKVIVIGTSNGGVLATWLAMQAGQEQVLAYILMSPNFGLRDKTSVVATWPWAKQIVPLLAGPEYSWTPTNPQHAKYWTESYPSAALLQPINLTRYVVSSKLESIQKPILVVYAPDDEVVDTKTVENAFARFGSPIKKIVQINDSDNPSGHVLAGDILAPADTDRIMEIMYEFVSPLQ